MRLCVIGVGQAGGRVADLFAYYNTWKWSNHGNVGLLDRGNLVPVSLAVNTAKSDLIGLGSIPKKNRILIGQTQVKGHGTGTNNELGAKIVEEEAHNINRALSTLRTHHIDAFLVIAGLGGGTGSGGSPVLVRQIKDTHETPVYALAILPARDEGKLMTFNAARSLLALKEMTEGLIIFDNESWKREGASLKDSYLHMNLLMVKPFGYLLGPGETKSESKIGAKAVDVGDIINTFGGFSVIGYAERKVERSLNPLKKSSSIERLDKSTLCYSIIKTATSLESLTARCDIRDTERALMVVSGPPGHLDREGIERARKYLEDSIWGTEVRGGDFPLPRAKKIAGVVLLSGLTNVPRVKEVLEEGVAMQKVLDKKAKGRAYRVDLSGYKNKLKPLIEQKKSHQK